MKRLKNIVPGIKFIVRWINRIPIIPLLLLLLGLVVTLSLIRLFPIFKSATIEDLQKIYYLLSPIITIVSIFIAYSLLKVNSKTFIHQIAQEKYRNLTERIKEKETNRIDFENIKSGFVFKVKGKTIEKDHPLDLTTCHTYLLKVLLTIKKKHNLNKSTLKKPITYNMNPELYDELVLVSRYLKRLHSRMFFFYVYYTEIVNTKLLLIFQKIQLIDEIESLTDGYEEICESLKKKGSIFYEFMNVKLITDQNRTNMYTSVISTNFTLLNHKFDRMYSKFRWKYFWYFLRNS